MSVAMVLATLSTPPNVIIFFVDDWGWGDMGANWPPAAPETPHLDRLATKSLRFTDFHSGASVCPPARAAILPGRLGLLAEALGIAFGEAHQALDDSRALAGVMAAFLEQGITLPTVPAFQRTLLTPMPSGRKEVRPRRSQVPEG